jgi:hypothetical protein
MLVREKVWVRTEKLVEDGRFLMVGDTKVALGPRQGGVPAAASGAGVDSEQPQESPGSRGGPGPGPQAAEAVRHDRVARWVVDGAGSGAPDTADDGVESEPAKEVLPVEGPGDTTLGCWASLARWKWKRRRGKWRERTASGRGRRVE